jgi:ATPase subunit of ABC transporter with duplicated ATPase domains
VNDAGVIVKKKGYLFDFVDLCIEEGETYCILGSNASGKSTLLQILGKLMDPVEGRVKHALNIKVGYLDQELVDNMIQAGLDDGAQNAIIFLLQRFPKKTEQDIRSELINFGISPLQATTDLCFLSGGERSRVCLAAVMLQDPHVLLLDNPTSNLDPESVQALIHGLKQWKGTLVLVSHDAHLVRSLEAQCHVLMSSEGKLRRVQGGVDDYLRSFAMSNRTSSR